MSSLGAQQLLLSGVELGVGKDSTIPQVASLAKSSAMFPRPGVYAAAEFTCAALVERVPLSYSPLFPNLYTQADASKKAAAL